MPAWEPGQADQQFKPFDEAGEIRDGLPPELTDFLDKFDIQKNFTCEVKKYKDENFAGKPIKPLSDFEGTIPYNEAIVASSGPGCYATEVTWTPKGGKKRTEVLKQILIGPYWDDIYEKAKEKRHKDDLERAERKAEVDAIKNRTGTAPVHVGPSPKEYVNDLVQMSQLMSGNDNGNNGTNGMVQLMLGMMQMQMKSQENTMTLIATLIAGKTPQQQTDPMQLLERMLTLRDGLMPRDRHWIQDVVENLAEVGVPLIQAYASRGREVPASDPEAQKLDRDMTDVRKRASVDPTFLKALVDHMDKRMGSKLTDKALNGFLNITRNGPDVPPPSKAGTAPAAPTAPEEGMEDLSQGTAQEADNDPV